VTEHQVSRADQLGEGLALDRYPAAGGAMGSAEDALATTSALIAIGTFAATAIGHL
jgi:hypothetical protein